MAAASPPLKGDRCQRHPDPLSGRRQAAGSSPAVRVAAVNPVKVCGCIPTGGQLRESPRLGVPDRNESGRRRLQPPRTSEGGLLMFVGGKKDEDGSYTEVLICMGNLSRKEVTRKGRFFLPMFVTTILGLVWTTGRRVSLRVAETGVLIEKHRNAQCRRPHGSARSRRGWQKKE